MAASGTKGLPPTSAGQSLNDPAKSCRNVSPGSRLKAQLTGVGLRWVRAWNGIWKQSDSSLLNTALGMAAVGEFPKHLCGSSGHASHSLQFLCKGLCFAERGLDRVPAGVRSVKKIWGPWMLGSCGSEDGGASPEPL